MNKIYRTYSRLKFVVVLNWGSKEILMKHPVVLICFQVLSCNKIWTNLFIKALKIRGFGIIFLTISYHQNGWKTKKKYWDFVWYSILEEFGIPDPDPTLQRNRIRINKCLIKMLATGLDYDCEIGGYFTPSPSPQPPLPSRTKLKS